MLRCGPRDSCDTGADAVMLPIADGAAGFSALPPCAGSGRCEARCSAGRAASGRVVERGGALASRLEVGAAGDGVVGAGCSRFVEQPSMRVPLDGCAALLDCWAAT